MEQKSSITTEKAREILGKRGQKMTEQEIESLLISLNSICSNIIDSVINDTNNTP